MLQIPAPQGQADQELEEGSAEWQGEDFAAQEQGEAAALPEAPQQNEVNSHNQYVMAKGQLHTSCSAADCISFELSLKLCTKCAQTATAFKRCAVTFVVTDCDI